MFFSSCVLSLSFVFGFYYLEMQLGDLRLTMVFVFTGCPFDAIRRDYVFIPYKIEMSFRNPKKKLFENVCGGNTEN